MTVEEILDDCFPEWRELDAAITAAHAPQIAAAGGVDNYVKMIAREIILPPLRRPLPGEEWNDDAPYMCDFFDAAD